MVITKYTGACILHPYRVYPIMHALHNIYIVSHAFENSAKFQTDLELVMLYTCPGKGRSFDHSISFDQSMMVSVQMCSID